MGGARSALGGVLAAVALLGLTGPAASAAPVTPRGVPAGVDDLAPYEGATTCAPVQPGTAALRRLLVASYGPQTIGDTRACPVGAPVTSEHVDGRALDWVLDAADPADRATAEEFLTWLVGPAADAASATAARRLGVMYVIWNGRIWKSYQADRGWQPYTGGDPHADHVHLSLSIRGAAAETSWWTGRADPVEGHWVRLGAERSALGPQVSASAAFRSGRRVTYRSGSILWSGATQAREVRGDIAASYFTGSRAALLGLPVTDELPTPGGRGRFNHFQAGSVYWSPATGAHEVHGAIRDTWASLGWETGRLGFPTSDEEAVDGGRRSAFTGGSITYDVASGRTTVSYA